MHGQKDLGLRSIMNSLFSRLLNKRPENFTTEILVYLLNRSGNGLVRDLLVNQLGLPVTEHNLYGTWISQCPTSTHEETTGYLDLYYETAEVSVGIENKFWGAKLTHKQPNQYLKFIRSRAKPCSALVFLVPPAHASRYWEQIRAEVKDLSDLEAGSNPEMRLTLKRKVTLMLLTWDKLIDSFMNTLEGTTDEVSKIILDQLGGFYREMTRPDTPFEDNSFFASHGELFWRIIRTVELLRDRFPKSGLDPGICNAGKDYFGFYFVYQQHRFWIGFSAYRWGNYDTKYSLTPFWFQVIVHSSSEKANVSLHFKEGEDYFHDTNEEMFSFPLRIEPGFLPDESAQKCYEAFDKIWKKLNS